MGKSLAQVSGFVDKNFTVVTWENILGEGTSQYLKGMGNKTYKDNGFGWLIQSCIDVLEQHTKHLCSLQLSLKTRTFFFIGPLISCSGRVDTTWYLIVRVMELSTLK